MGDIVVWVPIYVLDGTCLFHDFCLGCFGIVSDFPLIPILLSWELSWPLMGVAVIYVVPY